MPSRFGRMPAAQDVLLENLRLFVAFARARVGDPHLAEDIVQESLLKALASDRQPEGEENTLAWFYRILRHSIIDLYRRSDARKRAMERFAEEFPESPNSTDERLLCQCFKRLLPAIPQQYRDVLQKVDLEGKDLGDVADDLKITKNNLTVRLHRARRHLRDAVTANCRACSKHGCLDCNCKDKMA